MTLHTFHSMKAKGHADHRDALKHHAGKADGGKIGKDTIKRAIREHEDSEHGGKHSKLHLEHGGHVEGAKAGKRLDRASGGRANKSKHNAPSVHVNVISGAPRTPPAMGAPGGMMPPPHPPMPPPGAPPGGAPGGMPPGAMGAPPGAMPPRPMQGPPVAAGVPMRAKGGRVKMEFGAGGGEGRMEKMKDYGKEKPKGENANETSDLEDMSAGSGKERMARGGRKR